MVPPARDPGPFRAGGLTVSLWDWCPVQPEPVDDTEAVTPQPVSWPDWVVVPPRPRPPGHYTAARPRLVARALEDVPDS